MIEETVTEAADSSSASDATRTTVYQAQYQFDAVGNRLQQTINGVDTDYRYDANDRLTETSSIEGVTQYQYDNQGNTLNVALAGGQQTQYQYNVQNQLISREQAGQQIAYRYNADGIRNGKSLLESGAEQATDYVVDSNRAYAQVVQEIAVAGDSDSADQISVNYIYGDDLLSQQRINGSSEADSPETNQWRFYHYDALGSTRLLTDQAGQSSDQYDYAAYGELLNQTGSSENNYRYTGEQYDPDLDQYYLRARYYDQGVGRFTQQDSWQGEQDQPISLNKYIYAANDPVYYVDPTGNIFALASVSVSGYGRVGLAAASASAYSGVMSRVASALIGAGLGYGLSEEFKQFIAANAPAVSKTLEEKKVRSREKVNHRSHGRSVLYHYTSKQAALLIGATGKGYVTPAFRGLGTNGNTRPAGFYATDIAPWDVSRTQADLSALFYGGNRSRDVSWFVAVDALSFTPVYGASREYVQHGSKRVGVVNVDASTIGPNLMLPGL